MPLLSELLQYFHTVNSFSTKLFALFFPSYDILKEMTLIRASAAGMSRRKHGKEKDDAGTEIKSVSPIRNPV